MGADVAARDVLITAVVLSFNSERYIRDCIESLAKAFEGFEQPCEIRIIDNGSADRSVAILRELERAFDGTVFVEYLPRNTGTTASRNLALKAAKGRYVLVLDSDATASFATLKHLIAVLEGDRTIGLVAPRLNYPDGRYQISFDQFPTVGRKLTRLIKLKNLEQASEAPAEAVDVDYLISAFWLMPRSTLERVGLLDERIFYSPEDVDYCIRIWKAGLRIVYEPSVAAIHDAQEISRGLRISRFTLSHAKGLCYFFLKHGYCLSLRRVHRRIAHARMPGSARRDDSSGAVEDP